MRWILAAMVAMVGCGGAEETGGEVAGGFELVATCNDGMPVRLGDLADGYPMLLVCWEERSSCFLSAYGDVAEIENGRVVLDCSGRQPAWYYMRWVSW